MPSISTVTSIGTGVCCCHNGCVGYITTFVSGASSTKTNSLVTTNLTTIGISSCGHPTIVITTSSTVRAESTGVHRVADVGTNCNPYTSVTGSPNTNAGD